MAYVVKGAVRNHSTNAYIVNILVSKSGQFMKTLKKIDEVLKYKVFTGELY